MLEIPQPGCYSGTCTRIVFVVRALLSEATFSDGTRVYDTCLEVRVD